MEKEKPLGTVELWKKVEIILKEKVLVKYILKHKETEVRKTWRASFGAQDNTNDFPLSTLTLSEISSSQVRWYSCLCTTLQGLAA